MSTTDRPADRNGAHAIQVVIANRRDDLAWTARLGQLPKRVYNVDAAENDDRQAAITVLRHVVEQYSELADVTVVLPGDAGTRCPWIVDRVRSLPRRLGFQPLGTELFVEPVTQWSAGDESEVLEVYRATNGLAPDILAGHVGSMFAVGREQIRRWPRAMYEQLLSATRASADNARVLECMWELLFAGSARENQGIVTAGDQTIFRDLQFLLLSLRDHNAGPIVVYDLGLETYQLQWCLRQPNVTCRPLPPLTRVMREFVGSHRWQAWLKPAYIWDAPFDRILWLDADCVVLDSVSDAFARIDDGPFLLPEVCPGGGRNHPRLYKILPIDDREQRQGIEINNGVIGLDRRRDQDLLAAWLYGVEWAISNSGRRHLMRWYDQGAMLWAILKTGREGNIVSDQTWNYPAKPLTHMVRQATRNGQGILAAIREAHPEASLVHWFGMNKLSVALDNEIRNIFLGDDEHLAEASVSAKASLPSEQLETQRH